MYETLSSFHLYLRIISNFKKWISIKGIPSFLPKLSNKCGMYVYKFVLKHPLRQDIFKQKYRNVVLRDHILTLYSFRYCTCASLNTCCIKCIKLIIVRNISNLRWIHEDSFSWLSYLRETCRCLRWRLGPASPPGSAPPRPRTPRSAVKRGF